MKLKQVCSKYCIIVLLIFSACLISFSRPDVAQLPNCMNVDSNNKSRNVFIANTLDGKTNVLDAITGKLLWSHKINDGPLLSSTIGNVIVDNKGELIKLFPSLDGHLYTFNGRIIQKTPFSAEKLIKNSLKFSDNVLLVGGHESKIIYVDFVTGELLYECGLQKCPRSYNLTEDVILFKKSSQSVRAINSLTGKEEWHFVVNEPQLLKVSKSECRGSSQEDFASYSINFELTIQTGLISTKVDHSSNGSLFTSWTHKFDSPLVNIWRYENDELTRVNIFDHSTINVNHVHDYVGDPFFYIGVYQDQFYLQLSDYDNEVPNMLEYDHLEDRNTAIMTIKPLNYNHQLNANEDNSKNYKIDTKPSFEVLDTKSAGFYLFYLNSSDKCNKNNAIESSVQQESEESGLYVIEKIVTNSLSYYWKEIAIICVSSWVCISIAFSFIKKWYFSTVCPPTPEQDFKPVLAPATIENETSPIASMPYHSRYQQDFEPVKVLGKGGYGVVFEAKHKIDESLYAVKRIQIPTNREKRDKFMREIRALSTLEHTGIVRYYSAWIEEPPPGWQESQDQLCNLDFTQDYLSGEKTESIVVNNRCAKLKSSFDMSLDRGDDDDSLEIVFEPDSKHPNDYEQSVSKSICNNNSISEATIKSNLHCKVFVYIQMQLCQKDTLKDWLLANKKRNKGEMLKIFTQITEAVDYVHSSKLIHRDLKPSNIFFAMNGVVKIGDFGLVTRACEDDPEPEERSQVQLDEKHTNRVGTQIYMSPEQMENKPYDHKVDIYSLGIILFELLASFNTEMERIQCLQRARNKKFSEQFKKQHFQEFLVLDKLLAFAPNERPEACELLKHDLFRPKTLNDSV